jgi:hypothetical protein
VRLDLERVVSVAAPFVLAGGFLFAFGLWASDYYRRFRRRRKLLAKGFNKADLKSKASLFRKLGEMAKSRLPNEIRLTEIDSHSWSDAQKHRECQQTLEQAAFTRVGTFLGSPQHWITELWVSEQLRSCGAITEAKTQPPYLDLITWYRDGTHASFANRAASGLDEGEQHTHWCGGEIPSEELLSYALEHRPQKPMTAIPLDEVVTMIQQTCNDHLARRREVGFTAEGMERFVQLRRASK